MLSVFIRSVIVASVFAQGSVAQLKKLQKAHTPREVSNDEVKYLAGLSDSNYTNAVLDNILIPRVVGTPNHEKVFAYIKNQLQNFDWNVEVDEFIDQAPAQFGKLTFKNIIATLNPAADRFLVLACHYDSKYFADEEFVGATDSAVPCAMMLNLAKVMQNDLSTIKTKSDLSLKLLFFDGEEAFVRWGPRDSIYGARHLAERYHKTRGLTTTTGEVVSDLDKIDILVLLDLIGHKQTMFYSYFENTQNWYVRLTIAEDKLDNLRLLKKSNNERYFLKRAARVYIEDDHIPFLRRNVPILHLISNPFPDVWHTSGDNRDIVDMVTVENINKILRVFVAEYLNVYLEPSEDKTLHKEL